QGLFRIERVDLQTAASHLSATGQFSFAGDSNLQVALNSSDATELQRIAMAWGAVEDQVNQYGVEVAGQLAFNGNIRGKLAAPDVDGHFSVGSIKLNGQDVGALTASLVANETELRVADGRLTQTNGGGIQFNLRAPRSGENNISVQATLDRANAALLLAALPLSRETRDRLGDTQSDISGRVAITGLPGNMAGNADLRLASGRLAGEQFESIVAKATFTGSSVKLDTLDGRFA